MKLAATITAVSLSLATGCLQPNEPPAGFKNALPTAEGVAVNVPEGAAASAWAIGEVADYYQVTRQVSRDLNGGAAWVLILAHTIVQFPPTEVRGDVYTWGPHSDALDPAEWRMVVTENDDGTYDWSFDGRSKLVADAEFETLISGHAVPGELRFRGSGSFFMDFDAAERVNPLENDASGTAEFTYDLMNLDGTPASLTIDINTVAADENGIDQPVSLRYAYAENADKSGDLQFQLHGDLDDSGSAFEDALIRSRWLGNGSGRSDIMVSGGDLGSTITVTASECWDTTFRRTYYTDSEEWQATEGDVAACAFADQDLPDSL